MPDTTVDKSGRWDPSTPLTAREAEQRARAEVAEELLISSENDISAARAAVRAGDWEALRRALGVADELPQMHTAPALVGRCGDRAPSVLLDTLDVTLPPIVCALPAGHAGWHRDERGAEWGPNESPQFGELSAAGLTAEQEIRAEALAAAAQISAPAGYDSGEVLDIAARFESYLRYGYGDVDEPERLRTGEICQPGQPFACGDYHHDPSVDHSSHSQQWIGICPECPSEETTP